MASAWLIKRFIDPKARFRWLKNPKDCPRAALGFDFDGATFTHVGARVTFEVLVASFGLEDDKALVRLGELVHFLDVGGVPVAEARGLEMILAGAREQHHDDNKLLAEAGKNFDYLYQKPIPKNKGRLHVHRPCVHTDNTAYPSLVLGGVQILAQARLHQLRWTGRADFHDASGAG